jgi:1,4-dihydroxy-2-naphthoyl-CoA hydrolase
MTEPRKDGERARGEVPAPPTAAGLSAFGQGYLPGLLGIEFREVARGRAVSRLPVRQAVMGPNGYLHAATVVGLADTSCGYGTVASLPDGARGFTTIELKANFLGTVREGAIACEATLVHGGRTTQVWDARVTDEATGRTIAIFRCTQILLYPG